MRRPAVFFDRDNTLIIGNDYLGDPAQVKLVAGAAAAVARCRSLGFATVVVSNQSGVARGLFDEDAVKACNRRMDEMLLAANPAAVIDRHEYCPFHPEAKIDAYRQDSFLRKPKPGMILAAADALAIDLARSWVVGDAPRDIAAGKAAGCRTVLINDPSLAPSPAALEQVTVPADFVVTSLTEAIETIAHHTSREPSGPTDSAIASVSAPTLAPSAPPERPAAAAKPPVSFIDRDPPPPARSSRADSSRPDNPRPNPPQRSDTPRGEPPRPDIARPAATPARTEPMNVRVQVDTSRLEMASQQLLLEVKKLTEQRGDDFSVSKLIAGVVQVLALASMLMAYFFFRNDLATLQSWLLVGIFLQAFTISLLIMSRQK